MSLICVLPPTTYDLKPVYYPHALTYRCRSTGAYTAR